MITVYLYHHMIYIYITCINILLMCDHKLRMAFIYLIVSLLCSLITNIKYNKTIQEHLDIQESPLHLDFFTPEVYNTNSALKIITIRMSMIIIMVSIISVKLFFW